MLETWVQNAIARTDDLDLFASTTLGDAAPKTLSDYDHFFSACANTGPFSVAVLIVVSKLDDRESSEFLP